VSRERSDVRKIVRKLPVAQLTPHAELEFEQTLSEKETAMEEAQAIAAEFIQSKARLLESNMQLTRFARPRQPAC
jgi:hypothetical protein